MGWPAFAVMIPAVGLFSVFLLFLWAQRKRAVKYLPRIQRATQQRRLDPSAGPVLRVVSLNVHGLPWPICGKCDDRMRDLQSFVRKYNGVDLFVFQEVFSGTFERALVDTLGPEWTIVVADLKRFPKLVASGLMAATRLPVLKADALCFGGGAGNDAWADKGYLGITVRTSNGKEVTVANTHLQNRGERNSSATHRRQMHLVSALSNDIVVGDFNTPPGAGLEVNGKSMVAPATATFPETNQTLDYAYSGYPGHAATLPDVVSDHWPVMFEFDVS